MKLLLKIGVWILAIVASFAAVTFAAQLREMRNERDKALQLKEILENQIHDLTKVQQKAQLLSDEITKNLAETAAALEKYDSLVAKSQDEEPESTVQIEALSTISSVEDREKPVDEKSSNFLKNMSDLFSGENGEALIKMSADRSVNLIYGNLFNELKLPPSIEVQASETISKYLAIQMQSSFKLMSGDKDQQSVIVEEHKNTEQQLRDELSTMFSPHEMALYDQYVEEMPRHSLEQSYDLQLKMSGSKMTPESYNMVKMTLVDEVLELMPDYGKSESISITNPQMAFESQRTAIDRAREKLRTQLDADQFSLANQFFNQQEAQLKMAEQMFRQ